MSGITRGEAIWEQARDTALPDTQDTLVTPPVEAGQAKNDEQDARLDAIEARLAGIEAAIGLYQPSVTREVGGLADGGVAEMMDAGWVRLDDSDVAARIEDCADPGTEVLGIAEDLTAEIYGVRHVRAEAGRLLDGDLAAELYGDRAVPAEGLRLGDSGLAVQWYGDSVVPSEGPRLADSDLTVALV
jgi:hypothetical protein